MISTHVTFQARGAVREAAKTFGMPPPEIDRVARHLPWRLRARARRPRGSRPSWPTSPSTARPGARCCAPPRRSTACRATSRSTPAASSSATARSPTSLPLERSAKGLVVTQYDMHGVEATGLVKIDLLGNRALAVIADVGREARTLYGDEIDLDTIPEDDARTGELLCERAHARLLPGRVARHAQPRRAHGGAAPRTTR